MVGFMLHPECTGDHLSHLPIFWSTLSAEVKRSQLDAELELYFAEPERASLTEVYREQRLKAPRTLESWMAELDL